MPLLPPLVVFRIPPPLYTAEHVHHGKHLEYVTAEKVFKFDSKKQWEYVTGNHSARYHYLTFPEEFRIPASVVDFKHYFSVSLLSLHQRRESDRVCRIADFHREDLCHRFATFLSRIAVPDPHDPD